MGKVVKTAKTTKLKKDTIDKAFEKGKLSNAARKICKGRVSIGGPGNQKTAAALKKELLAKWVQ